MDNLQEHFIHVLSQVKTFSETIGLCDLWDQAH